jgi:hypothetical protein
MLSVGCASTPTMKSVAGAYELISDNAAASPRVVLLDNGVFEAYRKNGNKSAEGKWKIVDGDIHAVLEEGIAILMINTDGSITWIAEIEDGKRTDTPKEHQVTWKKIK